MNRIAITTVFLAVACVGLTLLWEGGPWTSRPPFHYKKANREFGYSWRIDPVIDPDGRWLLYDDELNLLFLVIDDELYGSLTVHGSQERLTLGSRQGMTTTYNNPKNALFVGGPAGVIHEFRLPDRAAMQLMSLAIDERGNAIDVVELLYDQYSGPDELKLRTLLEDILPPSP